MTNRYGYLRNNVNLPKKVSSSTYQRFVIGTQSGLRGRSVSARSMSTWAANPAGSRHAFSYGPSSPLSSTAGSRPASVNSRTASR